MRTIDIFISHSWTYDYQRENLTNLLNKRTYFNWRDYSVPVDDPLHTNGSASDLERKIREQLRQASIVIILGGVYATYSKWINKEIKMAQSCDKPILTVIPRGQQRISSVAYNAADQVESWNADSIVAAIRDLV